MIRQINFVSSLFNYDVEDMQTSLTCSMHSGFSRQESICFDNCVTFMSDTTNIMDCARSGVEILVRVEFSHLYDVGFLKVSPTTAG